MARANREVIDQLTVDELMAWCDEESTFNANNLIKQRDYLNVYYDMFKSIEKEAHSSSTTYKELMKALEDAKKVASTSWYLDVRDYAHQNDLIFYKEAMLNLGNKIQAYYDHKMGQEDKDLNRVGYKRKTLIQFMMRDVKSQIDYMNDDWARELKVSKEHPHKSITFSDAGDGEEVILNRKHVEQLRNNTAAHGETSGLGNVRQIMEAEVPNAYEVADRLMTSQDDNDRKVTVVSSAGKRAINEGNAVLEFNVAGSGYKQFKSVNRNLGGKNNLRAYDKNGNKVLDIEKKSYPWYCRFFPFLKSGRYATKKALAVTEFNNQFNNVMDDMLVEQYGERDIQTIYGKEKTEIRIKDLHNGQMRRYNLPGPLSVNGKFNFGDYQIDNLKAYVLEKGKAYILDQLSKNPDGKITVVMKGHSRGAVATGEAAAELNEWLHKNYPDRVDQVNFRVVQFDPVPGAGTRRNHKEVDLKKGFRKAHNIETTVLYSAHSNGDILIHPLLFYPELIKNADRVIILPTDHDVFMNDVDEVEMIGMKKHAMGYLDPITQKYYRGSGINDLPRGVYISDENKVIHKMDSEEKCSKIMKKILENTRIQGERHKTIDAAVKQWFDKDKKMNQAPNRVEAEALDRDMVMYHLGKQIPFYCPANDYSNEVKKLGKAVSDAKIELVDKMEASKNFEKEVKDLACEKLLDAIVYDFIMSHKGENAKQIGKNQIKDLRNEFEKTNAFKNYVKDMDLQDMKFVLVNRDEEHKLSRACCREVGSKEKSNALVIEDQVEEVNEKLEVREADDFMVVNMR